MVNIVAIITGIMAYVIGAIPIGYIIARLKGVQDIRKHGSGNIGATNVSRMFGLHYFFFIFLLDASKAFLFMYMILSYFPAEYLYCFAALFLLGNTCSLFLNGSGGKGVATLCGLLAALNLTPVLFLLGVWCCAMVLTKTVGISSVISVLCLPVYAFFVFACGVAGWIVWLHRSNIRVYWEKRCAQQ